MLARRREGAISLLLAAGAYLLAFVQRPGLATADTKINLHVDPTRFLGDVASMWTSTGQLGDVQSGQQAGYLFPMGPFFAAGHAVGLSAWVVQRLWLGTLLALAAWGVVRLLDALVGRPRGVAALTAGAVTLLNPFVVTYVNRTTVTLLAYAALPWLMLAVHRGCREGQNWREPRRWRWPAVAALLVTASGGGVNGAVTAWMLVGPGLLLLYELLFTGVQRGAVIGFLLRAIPLTVLASLSWVVPAYVQSSYGVDFLHFTEQPGTIWGTTSATESLRLMSFWLSYVGIGFSGRAIPYFDDAPTMLFSAPVVLGTLLLPAGALSGFLGARRWRYGPFFLGLALVGVVIMMAGFPEDTPLRHGLTFTYNRVASVRFLRASYKAAPLLAIALACLSGVGAQHAWALAGRRRAARWLRTAGGMGIGAVLIAASWPLVHGGAQDRQISFRAVPSAWRTAAIDLDRTLPQNSRAIVLPGELFSFYNWGGTGDPILPALSSRPVAQRTEVPYADLRSTDLLWTIDGLVHQERLLPGQLAPLLSLVGARSVITATDSDRARSDAPDPAAVAGVLVRQPGLRRATRSYGPLRSFPTPTPGKAIRLPQLRRYDLPSARGPVALEPARAPVVVDGSADALAGLAAFGALPSDRALLYSADLTPAQLRASLAGGGTLVLSDSNRRRAFVSSTLEQNTGPTLTAGEMVSADGLVLDPFGRGSKFETVTQYGGGISSVLAPASPEHPQFPEHAAYAALDNSPQSAWVADPTLDPSRRWLEVDFSHPRDVPYVDLLPYGDAGGQVRQASVAGRVFSLGPGWKRLVLKLRDIKRLRVQLTQISAPTPGVSAGAGGIRELRIPGLDASQTMRLPVDAGHALVGADLRPDAVDVVLSRTTGDRPFARRQAHGPWSSLNVADPGDPETTMRRVLTLPAPRRFSASGWVGVLPQASDSTIDRLSGPPGGSVADSSGRLDGEPRWRASGALDGDPRTAWMADYAPGATWLQWRTSQPALVRDLRLVASPLPVRRPLVVRLSWPGGSSGALRAGRGGRLRLPRAVRARRFRLTILRAVAPPGATAPEAAAVGIAEIVGAPQVRSAHRGPLRFGCGVVSLLIAGQRMPMRVGGSWASFGDGSPLPARSCGAPLPLPAGAVDLSSQPGPLAVDELLLHSPGAGSRQPRTGAPGRVLDLGRTGHGSYDGVRLAIQAPSWLVLGEGYNRGWRAWCDGRLLGAPAPIDGYANGWRVGPACHTARFAFAPNRLAGLGYLFSALTAVACVLLIVIGRGKGRQAAMPEAIRVLGEAIRTPRSLTRTLLIAVAVGAASAFWFGLATGPAALAVVALVLRRGIGAVPLTAGAGLLLGVVVPLLYLVEPVSSRGGNHYTYASEHMAAHWVGVAAIGLLTLALARSLGPLWSERRDRQADSSEPAAPPPAAARPA